ncbi:alpha/beta hydrolase [uncultured Faecalibaculum sp.]|uniref:alpha/beta hydrolase n=1 Tax=uncultured Faecalibaculum sp. TaxID=1729681 RepID=UPI0025F9BA82|nr:alpha/beta hydrolase [uncultured Faecalibaculum sp.]
MWTMIYVLAFTAAFAGSAWWKLSQDPTHGKYKTVWNDSVGTVHEDMAYGPGKLNRFDLYLPADDSQNRYGLVVYLHPGGFTGGDKAGDRDMCEWLTAKGYVSASINYTVLSGENPAASVDTMSREIREAIPEVVKSAAALGYPVDEMAIGGGSAGDTLAMIYAYRDAAQSPVPVKMVFGSVGPSSFHLEDWINMGQDPHKPVSVDPEADYSGIAGLFSAMSGNPVTDSMLKNGTYRQAMKQIDAASWVTPDSVPTVEAYGAWDKVQPFAASLRLKDALEKNGVPHEFFIMEHSGHGLQNDTREYMTFMDTVSEYLEKYMPVSGNPVQSTDRQTR